MRNVNLQRASLIDVYLRSADIRGASLQNSVLSGINLKGTVMPDGSLHP